MFPPTATKLKLFCFRLIYWLNEITDHRNILAMPQLFGIDENDLFIIWNQNNDKNISEKLFILSSWLSDWNELIRMTLK